jgi:hypothetical protein
MSGDITITLFRPVGQKELELIRQAGDKSFRRGFLINQFFTRSVIEEYAVKIARDWNTKYDDPGVGYVKRFEVRKSFLDQYEVQTVGSSVHQEYWIPAENLSEFNRNIVGLIEVIAEFVG